MPPRSKQSSTSKKKSSRSKKNSANAGGAAETLQRLGGGLRRLGALALGWFGGRELDDESEGVLLEVSGLLLVGVGLWLLLSLFSFHLPYDGVTAGAKNWGGKLGYYLAHGALIGLGWGSYLLVLLGLAWGGVLLAGRRPELPWLRLVGAICFLLASSLLLQLAFGPWYHEQRMQGHGLNALPFGPGGFLALELVGPSPTGTDPALTVTFGRAGLWILTVLAALSSFTLATERGFVPAIGALVGWLRERRSENDESSFQALAGHAKRMVLGWWDFLRGADLVLEPAPRVAEDKPAKKTKSKAKAKKKATPKKTKKQKEAEEAEAAAAEEPEWDESEEGEWDEDADGEWDAGEAWDESEEGEWDEDPDAEDGEWEEEEEVDGAWAEDEDGEWEEVEEEGPSEAERAAAKAKARAKLVKNVEAKPVVYDPPTPPPGPWKFPPLDVLEPPDPTQTGGKDAETISREADRLESVLQSFRVDAGVVGSTVGPAVTLYELEVATGTRMNKVTTLASEIAAALRAKSIRIIAPIPGRSTIGIEVPNKKRRVVRFSELINQDAYDTDKAALPLFLGMDAEGEPVVEDMAKMPHLLIAGQTGSGKSVCINTIIASLLLTRSPHDVQMIMIDPKMVELQMYSDVPHQMAPVVTDMKQATRVLEWACEKMEGRYDLFKTAGVRNIKGYNSLGEEGLKERMGDDFNEERTPRHVPYIVLIIDEMADLMMVSKKEAEQAITRLAQKSRAVGIHVIVATQRPSTDVITGVLKGNLPTRIAFTVASKIDSRVILDTQGAEKLLGYGDMLYNPPQSSQIKRVQGALVEDHELQAVVDFVCQDSAPSFSQELIQAATGETRGDGEVDYAAQDDLWDEAVRVILKSKRGSASLLQRALKIGYTRASRLVDLMTEAGILGDHKGSKSREIMITLEDWEEMHGAEVPSGATDE